MLGAGSARLTGDYQPFIILFMLFHCFRGAMIFAVVVGAGCSDGDRADLRAEGGAPASAQSGTKLAGGPRLACDRGDMTTGASYQTSGDEQGAATPSHALDASPAFGRADPTAAPRTEPRSDEFRELHDDEHHAYLVRESSGRIVSWASTFRAPDGGWVLDAYSACNSFFVANGGI
jgi:hypothetical protein